MDEYSGFTIDQQNNKIIEWMEVANDDFRRLRQEDGRNIR